ncbi:hypothetical protein pb186bvf_007815 [Paramecium bursaria]
MYQIKQILKLIKQFNTNLLAIIHLIGETNGLSKVQGNQLLRISIIRSMIVLKSLQQQSKKTLVFIYLITFHLCLILMKNRVIRQYSLKQTILNMKINGERIFCQFFMIDQ